MIIDPKNENIVIIKLKKVPLVKQIKKLAKLEIKANKKLNKILGKKNEI